MKSIIVISGTTFILSQKLIDTGVKFPNEIKANSVRHNQFKIAVKTDKGQTSFDFYGSHHDYINGVIELDEAGLKNAFYCFVSDACSGKLTFNDFCSEFGYDNDSRNAERIYKSCEKSFNKLGKITDVDIYELVTELQD